MATIRQAINETIERGISNKCVSFFFTFLMHADFDLYIKNTNNELIRSTLNEINNSI